MYLVRQDGLVHLSVSFDHLSSMNGNPFLSMKMKSTSPSLVMQRYMTGEIRHFAGTVPNMSVTGDIESMAMYAGQGVGLIKDILPASEVVKRLVEETQLLIKQNFQ
ncbi:nitronate monooxygenase [Quillaja saponaria]|uniref:Nitronate monooxygenase n=1 Tax=Quillaja saponaria TaxID=32244 RepID=A0AAD7P941_QUISA|nr:nitronate monooxygenase [Quillaja saponaria]